MVILSFVFWGADPQKVLTTTLATTNPQGIHISGNDATQPNQVSSAIPVMTVRPEMISVLSLSSWLFSRSFFGGQVARTVLTTTLATTNPKESI